MKRGHTLFITQAAVIAALYVVLTFVSNLLGLANGVIQVRFSEALTVLPIFTPAAIPGLFVGCILSNLLTGCALWDIIFGSLATLIGAAGTYFLRKRKILPFISPIAANTAVIPFVLAFVYGARESLPLLFVTVAAGEIISCGFLGFLVYTALKKYKIF